MIPAPGQLERIGHRGAPRERLENTLPGFLLAVERGADAVELDAHATRDGVVVVHHDEAVNERPIADVEWADLMNIDLGGGARVPRLADVLSALGERASVYVELKGRNVENAVIAVIRAHGTRFALHSFDHDAMVRVAGLAPDIARGVLFDRGTPKPLEALRRACDRIGPRDVWPHWSLVSEKFVRAAHGLNTRVIAWTVNSATTAQALALREVDGICSDDVRILAIL